MNKYITTIPDAPQTPFVLDKIYREIRMCADGQFLFLEAIANSFINSAYIITNGSPLFSGDTGGSECEIRKQIFDMGVIDKIVLLPNGLFANTDINTYLWVLKKNNGDMLTCVNAKDEYSPLKKRGAGMQRNMLSDENISRIVLCETEHKRISKWHFYYNDISLTLTETDSNGDSVVNTMLCKNGKPYIIDALDVCIDGENFLADDASIQEVMKDKRKEDACITVTDKKYRTFSFDEEKRTICATDAYGRRKDFGCGSFSYQNKKGANVFSIAPKYVKDHEIIEYAPEEKDNEFGIKVFLKTYVHKPYEITDRKVGVEVNFNKEFYKPEPIPSVEEIAKELIELSKESASIENELLSDLIKDITHGNNIGTEQAMA